MLINDVIKYDQITDNWQCFLCATIPDLKANSLPHVSHLNSLTPVCLTICPVSWLVDEQPFPHIKQLYLYLPACLWKWWDNPFLVLHILPHISQGKHPAGGISWSTTGELKDIIWKWKFISDDYSANNMNRSLLWQWRTECLHAPFLKLSDLAY